MSLLDEDFDLDIKDLIIDGLMHLMNIHNEYYGLGIELWRIKYLMSQHEINITIDDRLNGDGEMVMGYNYLCAGDINICKFRFFNKELFYRNINGDVCLYDKESVRYDKYTETYFVGPYRLVCDYESLGHRMLTVCIPDIINKDLKKNVMIF